MNPLALTGAVLICCAAAVILRPIRPEFVFLLTVAGVTVIVSMAFPALEQILETAESLRTSAGLDDGAYGLLLQGCGILLVTRICGDLCGECGQKTLETAVGYAGRIAVAALAAPYLVQLAQTVENAMT